MAKQYLETDYLVERYLYNLDNAPRGVGWQTKIIDAVREYPTQYQAKIVDYSLPNGLQYLVKIIDYALPNGLQYQAIINSKIDRALQYQVVIADYAKEAATQWHTEIPDYPEQVATQYLVRVVDFTKSFAVGYQSKILDTATSFAMQYLVKSTQPKATATQWSTKIEDFAKPLGAQWEVQAEEKPSQYATQWQVKPTKDVKHGVQTQIRIDSQDNHATQYFVSILNFKRNVALGWQTRIDGTDNKQPVFWKSSHLIKVCTAGYLQKPYLEDEYLVQGFCFLHAPTQWNVRIDFGKNIAMGWLAEITQPKEHALQWQGKLLKPTEYAVQWSSYLTQPDNTGMQWQGKITKDADHGVQWQGKITKDKNLAVQWSSYLTQPEERAVQWQGKITKDKKRGIGWQTRIDSKKSIGLEYLALTAQKIATQWRVVVYNTNRPRAMYNFASRGLGRVYRISTVARNSGGLSTIAFTTDHSLEAGDFVTVKTTKNTSFSGTYNIHSVTSSTISFFGSLGGVVTPTPEVGSVRFNNWISSSTRDARDFAPENLNTDIVEQVWRSQDGALVATVDCDTEIPQGVFVDTIAILNHNFTRSVEILVQGAMTPDFSSPLAEIPITWNPTNIFWVSPKLPEVSAKYWRFRFNNLGNPDGFLQVGTIVFGNAVIFSAECFINPITFGRVAFADTVNTEGFTNVSNDRTVKNYVEVTFNKLSYGRGNYRSLVEMFDEIRTTHKALWIPEPRYPNRYGVYGKLDALPEEKHHDFGEDSDWVDLSFKIDESL